MEDLRNIVTQSGNPFTVVNSSNFNSKYTGCVQGGTASGGDTNNGCNWFPNVVGSTSVTQPGPNEWFNTASFVNRGAGRPVRVRQ